MLVGGENLVIGRIVHFVMKDGKHRPAIVVQVWEDSVDGQCNLDVFTDGTNDGMDHDLVVWRTSVPFHNPAVNGPKPFSWHWPEKVQR